MFKDEKGAIPPSLFPAMWCFLLGVIYLGLHNVGALYYPSSYLNTPDYFISPFWKRMIAIWLCCKITMMKYLGVWLVGEGSIILTGIGYAGRKSGVTLWNGLSNVNPWHYETCINLQGVVESFNINTNDWIKRYVFKRLMFLGNKNISLLISLIFLAIWHGFAVGYFMCFLLEFVDLEAERRLRERLNGPISNLHSANPSLLKLLLRYMCNIFCYFNRTFQVSYGLISFELKKLDLSLAVYSSVYWIGHATLLIVALDLILPKKRKSIKEN